MSPGDPLYTRSLPGGGYVAVESERDADSAVVRTVLLVERRADPVRRVGHAPPVVAETVGADAQHAAVALIEIAVNNVEIARALQRWQARRL